MRSNPFLWTRPRLPYVGHPRTQLDHGLPIARSPRAFSAPTGAIRWLIRDQTRAIDDGWFLERPDRLYTSMNRAEPIPVGLRFPHNKSLFEYLLQGEFEGEPLRWKAMAFVRQQDRFGWTGAWEHPKIERYTPQLRWYREHAQAQRKTHALRTLNRMQRSS